MCVRCGCLVSLYALRIYDITPPPFRVCVCVSAAGHANTSQVRSTLKSLLMMLTFQKSPLLINNEHYYRTNMCLSPDSDADLIQ